MKVVTVLLALAATLTLNLPAVTVNPNPERVVNPTVVVLLDMSYIKYVRELSDHAMAERLKNYPQLVGLSLSGQPVGPETANAIHHLAYLNQLFLSGNYFLQSISREDPMYFSSEFISKLAQSPLKLEMLSLRESSINDDQLEQLSHALPLLETIDLSGCPLISDKGILALIQNCPKLKMMELRAIEVPDSHDVKPAVSNVLVQHLKAQGIEVTR